MLADLNDSKFTGLMWTFLVSFAALLIAVLLMVSWLTDIQEEKMFAENNLTECRVFNPNTGDGRTLWQKKCQTIPVYYSVRKPEDKR